MTVGTDYGRLLANQYVLEAAIRQIPGWEDFHGTPESAVGIAARFVESYARIARMVGVDLPQ